MVRTLNQKPLNREKAWTSRLRWGMRPNSSAKTDTNASQLIRKLEEEDTLPNSLYEASVTLTLKRDEATCERSSLRTGDPKEHSREILSQHWPAAPKGRRARLSAIRFWTRGRLHTKTDPCNDHMNRTRRERPGAQLGPHRKSV